MNWIIIAALDGDPWPVIYTSAVKPKDTEEITKYLLRVQSRLENEASKESIRVTGYSVMPADGRPRRVSNRFFTESTYPVPVEDAEEEQSKHIGFFAKAA
jgi:hypothetical protein